MTNSKLKARTSPRMLFDRRAAMRDGVELSCDVYLPPTGDGPWPTILNRTPYDNTGPGGTERAVWFAKQGYAVVLQDNRGRGDSAGVWKPFFDDFDDGYDSVEWCAAQPWSDGNVGMMGISYGGWVQWAAARDAPPHLKALVSTSAAGRWMEELPYRFGCFSTFWIYWLNAVAGTTGQRHQGVNDVERILYYRPLKDQDQELGRERTDWREWLEHQYLDDYWQKLSLDGHFHKLDVPALHITGWFDGCDFNGDQMGQLYFWHNMLESSPAGDRQWLFSGPWDHGGTWAPRQKFGERDFGPTATPDMAALHKRFFDRWLKGEQNGQDADKRVHIFTMGRNEWRDEDQWPPAGTAVTPFYFHSNGRANTLGGDGSLSRETPSGDERPDSYVYNPEDPTLSTPDLGKFPSPDYPLDNRWRIRRDDVLVYTSEPLDEDLEITGHPFVRPVRRQRLPRHRLARHALRCLAGRQVGGTRLGLHARGLPRWCARAAGANGGRADLRVQHRDAGHVQSVEGGSPPARLRRLVPLSAGDNQSQHRRPDRGR